MINLYSFIKDSSLTPKIEVSELLFAEYTCMTEETKLGFWSDRNYFAFIASGKKAWRTVYHTYEVNDGDILFIKKRRESISSILRGGVLRHIHVYPGRFHPGILIET